MQILVLGMHRSGTSVVSRLLNMMGAYFGPEGSSTGANPENPKGFWERRDVRGLNDMLLHSAGADWDRLSNFEIERVPEESIARFQMEAGKLILGMDAHRPWFLKEPRLCLLAPLWLQLLEVPVCVFVQRSPLEIARSLETRNGFSISFGLALWERYMTAALDATRGIRSLQVNHDDLMCDPVATVHILFENLQGLAIRGLRLPSDAEVTAFVDPALYRARVVKARGNPLSASQRKLWASMRKAPGLLRAKPVRLSAAAQNILTRHDDALEILRLKKEVAEAARLEEQRKVLRDKVDALLVSVHKRDGRIENLLERLQKNEEKLRTHQATIQTRDAQVGLEAARRRESEIRAEKLRKALAHLERKLQAEILQRAKLDELLNAAVKNQAKLTKWSDRLLQEFERVLRSTRWRLGCWLSLKRADEESKERQRLAQLIASRPQTGPPWSHLTVSPATAGGASIPGTSEKTQIPGNSSSASTTTAKIAPETGSALPLSKVLADPSAANKVVAQGQFVSIVIPVYNAHDELIQCLKSVQRHSRPDHPVVVLDDASPDERIWPLLQQWQLQHRNFRVVRNESNLGYTATVNRACELTGPGDIILLNSDTIVPPRWIEQMAACAYSRPCVATVTAISNAAGAFSVPRKNAINSLPTGWDVKEMARFVERTSDRIRPVVPTGNGFCLYITSAARGAIGLFNAEQFPNGYGEENDYCLRASAAGLVSLIDDATYVFHRRSASFETRKEEILKTSREVLDRIYPEYTELIREWSQVDELDPKREEMQQQLDRTVAIGLENVLPDNGPPCLLFVLHDGMGGTRFTSEDLSGAMAGRYRSIILRTAVDSWSVYEQFDNGLVPVRRYAFAEPWRVDRPMTPDRIAVIREICADYQVALAHVRHLLANGPELLTLLRQFDIPIVFSFHDFYTVCPTIQLLDETQTYCAGRCTAGAGDCPLPANWFRPPLPWLKHRYVHEHQRRMASALELCDACVTTSAASRELITQHFPVLDDGRFSIIEHGRDLVRLELAKAPEPGKPVRAVFFGAFNPAKGLAFILDLLRANREAGNPIELHILGQKSRGFEPEALGAVYHGPYQRDDLAERIRAIAPAVSLVPSLWPETYCHVLTEAWAMGLPVLASDIGTLRERILKNGGGWLLPVGNAGSWCEKLRALPDDLQAYTSKLQEIRQMTFPGVASMANDYDSIYARLLASRPALLSPTTRQPATEPDAVFG